MGCSKCGGGKSGTHCNLCSNSSNKYYPWGTTRKVCWRCHDRMVAAIAEHKMQIDRISNLLAGKDWVKKDYEKKVKKSK